MQIYFKNRIKLQLLAISMPLFLFETFSLTDPDPQPCFPWEKNNMLNFFSSENVAAWDTNFLIITGICLPAHSWHHHGRCPPLWMHLHPALLRPQLHLVLADILHVSHQHSSSYFFITFAELLKNGGLERTVGTGTYTRFWVIIWIRIRNSVIRIYNT